MAHTFKAMMKNAASLGRQDLDVGDKVEYKTQYKFKADGNDTGKKGNSKSAPALDFQGTVDYHGGVKAQSLAVQASQKYAYTDAPPGWSGAAVQSRSIRFNPNVTSNNGSQHTPYFSGKTLHSQKYPPSNNYKPMFKATRGGRFLASSVTLGTPSKTRASNFNRRQRNTTPLDARAANFSINGADELLKPPGPAPGTYEAPDSIFKPSTEKRYKYQRANREGQHSQFMYQSKCDRFNPTRRETDLSDRGAHHRSESMINTNGKQPTQIGQSVECPWYKLSGKKSGLKNGLMRMADVNAASAEGKVDLLGEGWWNVTFYIKTADVETSDSWSRHDPNESTKIFINDQHVCTVQNQDQKKTPVGKPARYRMPTKGEMVPIQHKVFGSEFSFKFEMSSKYAHYQNHMIVQDGRAECLAVDYLKPDGKPWRVPEHKIQRAEPPEVTEVPAFRPVTVSGAGNIDRPTRQTSTLSVTRPRATHDQPMRWTKQEQDDSFPISGYPEHQYDPEDGVMQLAATAPSGLLQEFSSSNLIHRRPPTVDVYQSGQTAMIENRPNTTPGVKDSRRFDVAEGSMASFQHSGSQSMVRAASLGQTSWKERSFENSQNTMDVDTVRDLDQFVEPKTRNIRFY
jgi:hypothetical protein